MELKDHPDVNYVNFLINGIINGFDTGISPHPDKYFECRNNLSARKDKNFVSEQLAEEIKNGFVVGPLERIPNDWYNARVSPLGVAQHKFSGKKRLINDLSAPHDSTESVPPSINSLIDKDSFSLKYVTVDKAMETIVLLGKGAMLSKFDIRSAFRLLPIRQDLWRFYCAKWEGKFYVFVRFTFGSRSSPFLFTKLSEAIHFIAINNYGITQNCKFLYLLDDFLLITSPTESADKKHQAVLDVFKNLNIPLADEKTEGPCTKLTYLGLDLDSERMECILPSDKVKRTLEVIQEFLKLKCCTKQRLLSLLGYLGFAARCVFGGRSFVFRMYEVASTVKGLFDIVTLSAEAKSDLQMWKYLLTNWNGVSMFHKPGFVLSTDLSLYTDSSSSVGFGGYFGIREEYFFSDWNVHPLPDSLTTRSMSYLELYPIIVAAIIWGPYWKGHRIRFVSDNEGTVAIINKGYARCREINKLMRRLVILATIHNFSFHSTWISTRLNVEADLLSRNHITEFQALRPKATFITCPSQDMVQFNP